MRPVCAAIADQPMVSRVLRLAEMKLRPAIHAVSLWPAMKKSSPVEAYFFR